MDVNLIRDNTDSKDINDKDDHDNISNKIQNENLSSEESSTIETKIKNIVEENIVLKVSEKSSNHSCLIS